MLFQGILIERSLNISEYLYITYNIVHNNTHTSITARIRTRMYLQRRESRLETVKIKNQ